MSLRTLAFVATASVAAARTLSLTKFDLGKHPLAVCNDGTPAGYYYAPSSSGTSTNWLVFMQGGGWCWDEGSCKGRSGGMVSSKDWATTVDGTGIFDSTQPEIADMNMIFLPYCTSDGWTGQISAPDVSFGFNFRGHNVVDAAFEEAVATLGMGAKAQTGVIFSGCSAGARGALFNLDRVNVLLQGLVPSGNIAKYGGALDSAFWVDIPPFNSSVVTLMEQAQMLVALANVTVSPACSVNFPPSEQWKCEVGEYAVPYLSSPYLLHAYQYDQFQLSQDMGTPFGNVPNKTPQQLAYDETFRNATRFYANKDTIAPARANTAAMLPACFKHCCTQDPDFDQLTVNGVSLGAATVSWFFGTGNAPAYIVDDCTGFNCGKGCPSV